ncbi:hypothetical protein CLV51_102867 [Chitinophaga niastensis]|uniref:Uncharacterized protein n=1 Tax=Chitinophaga niastensis TaxID=536980 RepID=A0A2P8HP89_CHINA|nr:hypothetical protein [Chitinophaga niastensis]PSL48007.1 hypothetical protein CLV51_102867 [Chitinophaga niastensis]
MKKEASKKLSLGKIKVASLNKTSQQGNVNANLSNSSCHHVCPTICSQNCPTGPFICL